MESLKQQPEFSFHQNSCLSAVKIKYYKNTATSGDCAATLIQYPVLTVNWKEKIK